MNLKDIDSAIEEGQSLKSIAQAYSEIANLKIKKIRAQTERNRVFFREISYVFGLIRKMAIKKKVNIPKPKKTVSLIITSNFRFYGTINWDLIKYFDSFTAKLGTDRIILGKAAVDYFKSSSSPHQEILLKDDMPNPQELTYLTSLLKDYNQVLVFYSTMKSLLVQQPSVIDITVSSIELPSSGGRDLPNQEEFRFIFEPDLPKILAFFESSVITLLLESTFLESELARTASRFISMDSAETEANKFIKNYQQMKAYAKRSLDNITILENYASMMAVRRNHENS